MTAQMILAVRNLAHRRRAFDHLSILRAAPTRTALDEALIRLALALMADGIVE